MENKVYIIDIREEFELTKTHLVGTNSSVEVINIPSRNIFANQEFIKKLSENSRVWLVCQSANRSNNIKKRYFDNNHNILSSQGGVKYLCDGKTKNTINQDAHIPFDLVKCVDGYSSFGPQQYMQIAFVFMIIMVAVLSLVLPKMWFYGAVAVMCVLILFQAFNKSCWLSKLIPLK